MHLADFLTAIPVQAVWGPTGLEVRGVAVDSRQVQTGFVFVAVKGRSTDGHLHVDEAVRRGAIAVVSDRAPVKPGITWVRTPDPRNAAGLLAARVHGEPAKKIDVIGITGTNGKTTTAYLLEGVLRQLAPPTAMMGTVVYALGEERVAARHTTPEAPEVQSFLARAVEAGCRFVAMEISSHGLALGRLQGMEFAGALFTNLSRDHLDFHRDMEDYFAAKRLLFERYLRPKAVAVIGIDDAYGRRLAKSLSHPRVTYGSSEDADCRILEAVSDFGGLELRFRDGDAVRHLRSPLIGRHNLFNLLAAYAAARSIGFEPEPVLGALSEVAAAPGRYESVHAGQPFQVIVDYAHTDDALRKLLETTRELPHRKILTVFGCGGDRDRSKRPLMGAVAARLSDLVILTSDNPRSEDPLSIIGEIELGAREPDSRAEVRIEPDRRKAIALALSLAAREDVVLVAGRGHEPYQVIGNDALPFDDRQVVRDILQGGADRKRVGCG